MSQELPNTAWPYRTELGNRIVFGGQTYFRAGKPWYEYGQIPVARAKVRLAIVFAFVATHNHFVLDREGTIYKQSAPVIKLPIGANDCEHSSLLGLLNSSTACFWMKQVFYNKGAGGVNEGFKQEEWEQFREFAGTGLTRFPMSENRPTHLGPELDEHAQRLPDHTPDMLLSRWESLGIEPGNNVRHSLEISEDESSAIRERMIALQEELDWQCYRLYGLIEDDLTLPDPPPLALGQRTFEIVLARKMAAGETQTTWFERHGSTPITELPADWPDDYRKLVERRIALIETIPTSA